MAYKKIVMTSVEEILKTDYGEQQWLVEEILPLQSISILSGLPENYKSWITLHLAICVAEGREFLGKFKVPAKRSVLIFDKENQSRYIQKRLKALVVPQMAQVFYNHEEEPRLDDADFVEELLKTIEQERIGLIVFDSLVRYHTKDENSSTQMAVVFGAIKKITNAGASVIFTHHHRKDQYGKSSASSLRGSSDIFAAVDAHFSLEFDKKHEVIVFTHHKARHTDKQQPFAAKVLRDKTKDTTDFEFVGDYDDKKERREAAVEAVMDFFNKSGVQTLMRSEIVDTLKSAHTQSVIDSALAQLVDETKLTRQNGERGKHIYTFKESPPQEAVENPVEK